VLSIKERGVNMRGLLLAGSLFLAVPAFLTRPAGVGRVRAEARRDAPHQAKKYFDFSPVEIAVPTPPTPVESGGRMQLVYELHITNFTSSDLTVTSLDIFNGDSPIASYKDEELSGRLFHLGVSGNSPDKGNIGGGLRAIVFMWFTVDKGSVPFSLRHRFTVASPKLIGSDEQRFVEGPQIEVRKQTPVVITPPFQNGIWAAGNGPSNTSVHRRALRAVNSKSWIAQRFATDWYKRGDNGKLVHDDPQKNENWYGYGRNSLRWPTG
jgi:hypothetical protein